MLCTFAEGKDACQVACQKRPGDAGSCFRRDGAVCRSKRVCVRERRNRRVREVFGYRDFLSDIHKV